MLHIDMITVAEEYNTLAGNGQNTIRLYNGKYQGMWPGDHVQMQYVDKLENPRFVIFERLIISAMVVAPLAAITQGHGQSNHSYWDLPIDLQNGSLDTEGARRLALQNHILSFYPGSIPAAEGDPDALFVALYF